MTDKEYDKLSDTEKRINAAKLCGWRYCSPGSSLGHHPERGGFVTLPDYLHDLNVMHEAEVMLVRLGKTEEYGCELENVCGFKKNQTLKEITQMVWDVHHATASQRCKAFVLTMKEVMEDVE